MTATDSKYGFKDTDITAPALNYSAITTSNATDLTFTTRGIYVGVGGDVVAIRSDNTAVTFKNAASGSIIPIRAIRVNTTSTTATDLVALY
jgi:hypothetical protein